MGLILVFETEVDAFSRSPNKFLKPAKMALGSGKEKLNLVLLVNKKYPESKHICSVLNSPQISIIRKLNLLIPDQGKSSSPSVSLQNLRTNYSLSENRTQCLLPF